MQCISIQHTSFHNLWVMPTARAAQRQLDPFEGSKKPSKIETPGLNNCRPQFRSKFRIPQKTWVGKCPKSTFPNSWGLLSNRYLFRSWKQNPQLSGHSPNPTGAKHRKWGNDPYNNHWSSPAPIHSLCETHATRPLDAPGSYAPPTAACRRWPAAPASGAAGRWEVPGSGGGGGNPHAMKHL